MGTHQSRLLEKHIAPGSRVMQISYVADFEQHEGASGAAPGASPVMRLHGLQVAVNHVLWYDTLIMVNAHLPRLHLGFAPQHLQARTSGHCIMHHTMVCDAG